MIRCEEALEWLWEFLDSELEPANESEVQRHLEVCSRCYPRYDFQRAYFELMRRIRDRDAVPGKLRRRLFERILEEDVAAGDRNGGNGAGGVA